MKFSFVEKPFIFLQRKFGSFVNNLIKNITYKIIR